MAKLRVPSGGGLGEFGLGLRRPAREFSFADDMHLDRHEPVADTAQFGTLAVEDADLIGAEPGFVQTARHGIFLHTEGRHGPGMDYIGPGHDDAGRSYRPG